VGGVNGRRRRAVSRVPARVLGIVLLFLVLVLGAVACSGSASAAARPVETNRVEMPPSYLFAPTAIQVPVGTAVTWHNGDNFTHSVQVAGVNDQGQIARPGESVSITFDRAGTYDYRCTFHPKMTGQVTVVAR
jgi:plastocyanin